MNNNNNNNKPIKFFITLTGDSGGEMSYNEECVPYNTFEEAKQAYVERAKDFGIDEDRDMMESIESLTEPEACGQIYSFHYSNSDLDDEATYCEIDISLVKSNSYKTSIKYEL